MGIPEGTFIAASCLVSLMGFDQAIMKGLLDMLSEETVTVEVASSGDDAEDEYTSECVKQTLQMTSPSSRWWDATVRVTMSLPYFGTMERVANLSLAHCAAAVGSVELLHKCKDPHELLEMSCDATTLHLAACFDHIFYVSQLSGMSITPFELRVALSRCDKEKRSIMHYACSNGHTTFLHVVLDQNPYMNNVIPLLQMSDANGCTPTACAVVDNHVDVLRLLDSRHLFKEHTVHFIVHNEDDKIFTVEMSLAHLACEYGCTDVLEFLHDKKCALSVASSEHRTPAMVAAMFGKLKIIKLLYSWGISMETVPEMAIACMHCGILQYLAKGGVDITVKGREMLKMEEMLRELVTTELTQSSCSLGRRAITFTGTTTQTSADSIYVPQPRSTVSEEQSTENAQQLKQAGRPSNALSADCTLHISADSFCGSYSEIGQKGIPEGIFIATCYLVSLMGLDQAIMKGLLDMLTEETVTVEVVLTGDDAQDKYTSECVMQALQMTSPSSRWWDATVRVTMSLPYFGTVERVGNLSLAHCAAAVGSVELLHKCKDPHELLETSCDASTLHLAACFDHIFYVSQFSGITPFELRVALSRRDKKKRSIMHYACSNGNTAFLHVVLEHLPYKNMVIPLLQMSDANGCTPTACAVVGNHVDVLRLLEDRHLFNDQPVHFIVHNEDGKIFNVETSLAHLACEYGCTEVLEFLHEKDCTLDRPNSERRTPAMVATMFGKLKIIKLLLGWGISMETVPEMGIACMQCGILQYLAESGVDVTLKGREMLKMEEVKLAATQPPKQTVSAAEVEAALNVLAAAHLRKCHGESSCVRCTLSLYDFMI